MKKSYTVHSAHNFKMDKVAKLADGGEATVQVDVFDVQLVPEDGMSGTIKVVFAGAEAAEAAKQFVMGKKVSIGFAE